MAFIVYFICIYKINLLSHEYPILTEKEHFL